ncbi:TonB-dependent receptor [Chitinophaga nivalis]|uniref:TonB-dependent receptor n=1 Tax=Chitinophaga nivalis TaxID=2991709 RepID=A0ABT3IRS2_9BACT|nr:TonB-dependent receptor [Chitinophaga nivalis]MCW3463635.1 TonB-dependent receptor [Chitinophaga nivalis]MCW3486675.1 TonB-dependent receptor [Chitinophaga nivalis]
MKRLLFLVLLGIAGTLHAQSLITGTVTNKANGQPLEGVTITLQQSGVLTDNKGHYSITLPKKGNHTLLARYIGFKPVSLPVQAGSSKQLDIVLEETGLFVKPVEISSLRAGKNAPFVNSTLTKEEIKKENLGQDLPMLLGQQPGVVTTSDAGTGIGYTGMRVRGSDLTRINVTVNGIPVNDAESQGTFFVNMPDFASSVNSIELQRGVGTSTNGAGAFGATLNLSTNEFNEKAYGEISNSYGSFNSWKHTVKAGSGLINDHFTIDARLSKISSDGYIDRATADLRSFYTSAAYISKKTAVRLNVFSGKEKTYQAWNGVPATYLKTRRTYNSAGIINAATDSAYNNETDNYQQDHYQLFLNQEINTNLNFNVALHMTRGRGYYEQYRSSDSLSSYGLPPYEINGAGVYTTDLVRQLWLSNYFYGGIFSVNRTGTTFNWSLGGGWNRYEGDHYGTVIWAKTGINKDHEYYRYAAEKNDFNVYWKGEYKITEALRLFADLQYRNVIYNMDGFEKAPRYMPHVTYHFFNPKAGISYAINPASRVFASIAVANKEPNRVDFESNYGATEPKPEVLRDVEAGYSWSNRKVAIQGNIYYMNYKNQLVQTGALTDVGAFVRTNIPKSYRMGVEVSGQVKLSPVFTIAANAALSENKVLDYDAVTYDGAGKSYTTRYNKANISYSPAFVGGYTLTAKPVSGLTIDLLGRYVSRQYLDNTSADAASLDPYFVSNLRFHYVVPQPLFRELGVQLLLNNIFDRKYEPGGSAYRSFDPASNRINYDTYYTPMAGFNFFAGLTIGF